MKNKKLIFTISFFLIVFSLFAKNSENNNSFSKELFATRPGVLFDAAVTKTLIDKPADELTYGLGLSVEILTERISVKFGLDLHTYDWDMVNKTYYLPAEIGVNFHLPLTLGAVLLDPYIGAAGNICLWNPSPTYGFSCNGGIRLIVFWWGINVFYKHEFLYPIRQKDSSINFGSLGIAFTLFIDGSAF